MKKTQKTSLQEVELIFVLDMMCFVFGNLFHHPLNKKNGHHETSQLGTTKTATQTHNADDSKVLIELAGIHLAMMT